jgi:hypothetical protein
MCADLASIASNRFSFEANCFAFDLAIVALYVQRKVEYKDRLNFQVKTPTVFGKFTKRSMLIGTIFARLQMRAPFLKTSSRCCAPTRRLWLSILLPISKKLPPR